MFKFLYFVTSYLLVAVIIGIGYFVGTHTLFVSLIFCFLCGLCYGTAWLPKIADYFVSKARKRGEV